jgi:hypothetical protein
MFVDIDWLAMLDTRELRASTVHSYARNLRLHVLPRLGGHLPGDLQPLHLDGICWRRAPSAAAAA